MNCDYFNIDGTVFVSDENGNITIIENYLYLDQVLSLENVLEVAKNRLQELKKEKKDYNHISRFIPDSPFFSTFTGFAVYLMSKCSLAPAAAILPANINERLVLFAVCVGTFISIPLLVSDIKNYQNRKRLLRERNAIDCETEFLESYIKEQKKILQNLKSNIRTFPKNLSLHSNSEINIESKEPVINNVDDTKELEELEKLKDFSYDLGYSIDEYYQYYQQGILREKLKRDSYDGPEIEFAEDYLEKKGPVLVKKRKKS